MKVSPKADLRGYEVIAFLEGRVLGPPPLRTRDAMMLGRSRQPR